MSKQWRDIAQAQEVRRLLDALAALGDADVIAAHLSNVGAVGSMCDCRTCPLHTYLAARLTMPAELRVLPGRVQVIVDGRPYAEALPERVREFIRRMDNGRYPELIADQVTA